MLDQCVGKIVQKTISILLDHSVANQNLTEEDSAIGGKAIVKKRMEEKISVKSGVSYGILNVVKATGHLHAASVLLNAPME